MEGPKDPEINSVRNVVPQGRHSREKNREFVEKQRLKQRDYGFVRHRAEIIDDPFDTPSESVGYLSSADRFHSDVVGELRAERESKIQQHNQFLSKKRAESLGSEEMRWERIQEERLLERMKLKQKREKNALEPRNGSNSVPYNPVTLEYNDSMDGIRLQQQHEQIKHRAVLRSRNLRMKSTSGYNPITGEDLSPIHEFPMNGEVGTHAHTPTPELE